MQTSLNTIKNLRFDEKSIFKYIITFTTKLGLLTKPSALEWKTYKIVSHKQNETKKHICFDDLTLNGTIESLAFSFSSWSWKVLWAGNYTL